MVSLIKVQTINLYQPRLYPQRVFPGAVDLVRVLVVVVLVLSAITLDRFRRVTRLAEEVAVLDQERQTLMVQVETLTQSPGIQPLRVIGSQQGIRWSRDPGGGMVAGGAAAAFKELSRARVADIWLERIVVRGGASSRGGMELEGKARRTEALPGWVAKLADRTATPGSKALVDELTVTRTPEGLNHFKLRLKSPVATDETGNPPPR